MAAADDVAFDPLNFVPLTVDEDIASAELSVKGVVTDRNLYRGLGLASAEIVGDGDGAYHLNGVLVNSGVAEVTIPRVLISFLDHDGRPSWVQTHYLEYSIRPRRSRGFTVALDDISAVEAVDVPLATFDNALQTSGTETSLEPPDLVAPEGLPYAGIRISLAGFVADDR